MIFGNLQCDVAAMEGDSSLFEADALLRRIQVLDELEVVLAEAGAEDVALGEASVFASATALRARLEKANRAIYQAVRREMQRSETQALLRWIDVCRDDVPLPGLGYDVLDELIAGVLQMHEPGSVPAALEPEQVFYQPTPVRHVLDLIQLSGLTANDVLVDLGSGLGQVCMLVSILTGARAHGFEVEGVYVASARACARELGLERVSFGQKDAREADLSSGTFFYLYTPFSGSMLRAVLDRLRQEGATRSIRIGTLGPCTQAVAEEPWLRAHGSVTVDRVAVFSSVA